MRARGIHRAFILRLLKIRNLAAVVSAAAAARVAHPGRALVSAAEALVSTAAEVLVTAAAEILVSAAGIPRRLVGVRRRTLAGEGPGLPTTEEMESARVVVPRRRIPIVLIGAVRKPARVIRLRSCAIRIGRV